MTHSTIGHWCQAPALYTGFLAWWTALHYSPPVAARFLSTYEALFVNNAIKLMVIAATLAMLLRLAFADVCFVIVGLWLAATRLAAVRHPRAVGCRAGLATELVLGGVL